MPDEVESQISEETAPAAEVESKVDVKAERAESGRQALRDAMETAYAEQSKDPEETKELASKEAEKPVAKTEQSEESKKAPETTQDWEKSFKELQGNFTRAQQQQKSRLETEFQKQLTDFKQKADFYDKLNTDFQSNPKLKAAIEAAYSQVDPDIQADPIYGVLQKFVQDLNSRIAPIEQHYTTERQQFQERQINDLISSSENAAKETFKSMFQKDMTEADLTAVLKVMHDEGIKPSKTSAEMIVKHLFQEKFIESSRQDALDKNLAKKKVGSKMSTVNVSKGTTTSDRVSLRDALEASWNG